MLRAPKPKHLGADYASQFTDPSVIAAYGARPPYPRELFVVLSSLQARDSRSVLELGCGTGDLTHGLVAHSDRYDAVEPSDGMLAIAQRRLSGVPNIRWFNQSAESFEPDCQYSTIVAAESLHWMEWEVMFPKLERALAASGSLAIVTVRQVDGLPWKAQLQELIARFTTNRDYRAYDIVEELSSRGLFHEHGRQSFSEPGFAQSLDRYVDSFHSRNGFSRDRMSSSAASSFDAELRSLVRSYQDSDVVMGSVTCTLIWGRPASD